VTATREQIQTGIALLAQATREITDCP